MKTEQELRNQIFQMKPIFKVFRLDAIPPNAPKITKKETSNTTKYFKTTPEEIILMNRE